MPQPNGFTDLRAAQIALQQQLASGAINPATGAPINDADIQNELNRLKQGNLAQAERNLIAQGIEPGAVAGEMQRLAAMPFEEFAQASAPTPQQPGAPVNPPNPSQNPIDGQPPNASPSTDPRVTVQPGAANFAPQIQPTLNALAGDDPRTAAGFDAGRELAGEFFAPGTLGRLNDQLSPAQAEMITRTNANAFGRPGEQQHAIDVAGANVGLANQRDPLTNQAISAVGSQVGTRDPRTERLLQGAEDRLGGFSTQELQALREEGAQGINRNFRTGLEALGQRQAAGGISGGINTKAALPIANRFQDNRGDLERRLILDDVALRDSRRRALEGFNEGAVAREFGEDASAAGIGVGTSTAENQARLGASQNLTGTVLNTGIFEQGKLENAQDLLANTDANLTGKSIFNLGQLGSEKASQIGLITGLGSFGAAQDTHNDIMDLGREQIEAAKKLKKGTSVSFGGLPGVGASTAINPGIQTGPSALAAPGFTYAGLNKGAASGQQVYMGPQGLALRPF